MWDDKSHSRIIEKAKMLKYKKEIMKDLKPCPFCGMEWTEYPPELSVEKWKLQQDTYRLVCPRCGAAGPDAPAIEWVIANWNNRAEQGERRKGV